jgi:hypothetical protein
MVDWKILMSETIILDRQRNMGLAGNRANSMRYGG